MSAKLIGNSCINLRRNVYFLIELFYHSFTFIIYSLHLNKEKQRRYKHQGVFFLYFIIII